MTARTSANNRTGTVAMRIEAVTNCGKILRRNIVPNVTGTRTYT